MDDYKITEKERETVKDIAADMLVSDREMEFGTNYDDYMPFLYEFSGTFHGLSKEGKRYLHDYLNKYLWEMGYETPVSDYLYFGGRFFTPPDVPSNREAEKQYAFRYATEVMDRIDPSAEVTLEEKVEDMCTCALLGWQMLGTFSAAIDIMYAAVHDEPTYVGGIHTYLRNGKNVRLQYVHRCWLPREDQDPEAYLTLEEIAERRARLKEEEEKKKAQNL